MTTTSGGTIRKYTVKSIAYQDCHLPTPNRYSIERNKACSVSWSATGTRLASGHVDRFGKVWAVDTGTSSSSCREVSSLHGHTGAVDFVRFSPSSNSVLCSVSNDKTVRIWDARVGGGSSGNFNSVQTSSSSLKCVHKVDLDTVASSVEWSSDGKCLLMSLGEHNISVMDMSKMSSTTSRKDCATLSIDMEELVGKCCFSPCGNYIVSSLQSRLLNDGILKLIPMSSQENSHSIVCHTAQVRSVHFSKCGTKFVTSSTDGLVGVWDTRKLLCAGMITRLDDLKGAALSSDSRFVASCSSGPDIDIADSVSGERIGLIPIQQGADDIAWSPSNNTLALAYAAGANKISDNDGDDDRDRGRNRPPPNAPPVSIARLSIE